MADPLYATDDQLLASLGSEADILTEDYEDGDLEEILTDQSMLIDDYIRNNVTLPFTAVPKIIEQCCLKLAVYEIYSRQARVNVPEHIRDNYIGTIKLLEKINDGKLKIGADVTPESGEGDVRYAVSSRYFTNRME